MFKLYQIFFLLFEITIMLAVVAFIISVAWLVIFVVTHVLDLVIPMDFATVKLDASSNQTCPVKKPFEKPPPMCKRSRWQGLIVYCVQFATLMFSVGLGAVFLALRGKKRGLDDDERGSRRGRSIVSSDEDDSD
jgi:hypothetical protein